MRLKRSVSSPQLTLDKTCILPGFDEIVWEGAFDAVWACASLLHVPRSELPDAFERLFRALKSGSVLYCSFKYGAGEREQGGRRFIDLDEQGLETVVSETGAAVGVETWLTEDQRPDRDERWLNALVRLKKS